MTELRPCPRCGSERITAVEIKAGYGELECEDCGFEFPNGADGMDMYPPNVLVDKWNSLNGKEASE